MSCGLKRHMVSCPSVDRRTSQGQTLLATRQRPDFVRYKMRFSNQRMVLAVPLEAKPSREQGVIGGRTGRLRSGAGSERGRMHAISSAMVFIAGVASPERGHGSSGTGAELPVHSPRLLAALCPAPSQPRYSCTSSLHAPQMGQRNCHPEPGDLIEIFRPGYQHWAVYVGDGYVIHVTGESQSGFGSSSRNSTAKAEVKKELLTKVAGKHKWRVNNKYDRSHAPYPVNEIIQHAEECIGREVPYNVATNNCEHFSTWLRSGNAVSGQVNNAIIGGATAAGAGGLAVVGGVLAAVMRDKPKDTAHRPSEGVQYLVQRPLRLSNPRSGFTEPDIETNPRLWTFGANTN